MLWAPNDSRRLLPDVRSTVRTGTCVVSPSALAAAAPCGTLATIAIPELVSKIPAAAATMVLTAYLGARAVCDRVFGWIQMVRELDAATTFDEVRAAGQRYGRVVGTQTARILILLATAAIAQGGLIARLMRLPRAAQASAALAAETSGVSLEAIGAVKDVRVLQGGVAIAVEGVAQGAVSVAMAAHATGSDPARGSEPTGGSQPEYRVEEHGKMPSPRPGQHSHHGVMSAWMKKHFPGYDPNKAPAILMPEEAHRATFGVYNEWRAAMSKSMAGKFDFARVSEA